MSLGVVSKGKIWFVAQTEQRESHKANQSHSIGETHSQKTQINYYYDSCIYCHTQHYTVTMQKKSGICYLKWSFQMHIQHFFFQDNTLINKSSY